MPTSSSGLTWLLFALMTVGSWGLYGIFLHTGQIAMADPENGRYKAFLFVGVAYLVTAVIGSLIVLAINGSDWSFPTKGLTWSLLAGTVGAIGAFGVPSPLALRGRHPWLCPLFLLARLWSMLSSLSLCIRQQVGGVV